MTVLVNPRVKVSETIQTIYTLHYRKSFLVQTGPTMTVFQEALAGLSKTFSAESKKSSHAAFIESQLLPTVQKLQKEIGWRRYKVGDLSSSAIFVIFYCVVFLKAFYSTPFFSLIYSQECQAPLQEAVLSLKIFQHEEWPDKNNKNSDHQSDALRHSSHDGKEESSEITENDDQMTVESQEVEETGTAVTMDKTDSQVETKDEIDYKHEASTPQSEQEEESKEEAFKPEASKTLMIKTLPDESFHDARNFSIDDDPQTRELVHPAILQTLEAFIMVLRDPTKQPRPTEIVLEGVTSIVANRYLSGRAGEESKPASLLHRLLESVAKSSESNNEAVQIVLISTLTTIMTSPKCSVHGNSMLTALRSTFHVYLVTKSATCKASAKRALLDMLKAVFFRMEAHEAVSHNSISPSDMQSVASKDSDTPTSITSRVSNANSFASQYHADAYYLLRSLCKLSSKELPADTTDEAVKGKNSRILFNTVIPTDPTELNSKILSLELILAAMEYSGEAFTSSKFLYLVQHYLCGSLLKNCVSTHTQVAFLSQKIFLVLVRSFFTACGDALNLVR